MNNLRERLDRVIRRRTPEESAVHEASVSEAPQPLPVTEQVKRGEPWVDPDCPMCHGTNCLKATTTRDITDPLFGKLIACPQCAMRRPIPVQQGLSAEHSEATFADFDLRLNPAMAEALAQCRKVASTEAWGAVLAGDIGCGKTLLAACALNESRWPRPGNFYRVIDLLQHLRSRMFDHEDHDAVLFYQSDPSLLVIDDVGTEKASDWTRQVLYDILDARCQKRLPTIVTTNDIESIDERLLSRYAAVSVVCEGQDVRRLKGVPA